MTWKGTWRDKALDDTFKLKVLMCPQVYGAAPLLYYSSVCFAKENFRVIQWTRWVTWEIWEKSYVCHLIFILLSEKFACELYIKLKLALKLSSLLLFMEEVWSPHLPGLIHLLLLQNYVKRFTTLVIGIWNLQHRDGGTPIYPGGGSDFICARGDWGQQSISSKQLGRYFAATSPSCLVWLINTE